MLIVNMYWMCKLWECWQDELSISLIEYISPLYFWQNRCLVFTMYQYISSCKYSDLGFVAKVQWPSSVSTIYRVQFDHLHQVREKRRCCKSSQLIYQPLKSISSSYVSYYMLWHFLFLFYQKLHSWTKSLSGQISFCIRFASFQFHI